MSEIKVNKLSPRTNCGTVQLGDSGDTFTIPAGATITNNGTAAGFGATGAASWDTTVKTTGFTAVSGVGYFVDTTAGAITVTLPASPSAGDVVAVSDYAGTADTNNITIARNGSNINGAAADLIVNKENSAVTLVYVDGTQGWKATDTSSINDIYLEPTYVTATGGTITTVDTDYKVHTFTGPGTFTVTNEGNSAGSNTIDYLVIGGGGGGGACGSGVTSGGGGAGGYRESSGVASGSYTVSPLGACVSALPASVQGYPITVGAGSAQAGCGNSSIFSTITSAGGGKGGTGVSGPAGVPGTAGGSGGGGGSNNSNPANPGTGAAGNTPPVSPPQGNAGGNAFSFQGHSFGGGAGGGATTAGGGGGPATGGAGGTGGTSSINNTPTERAGGGGGAGRQPLGGTGTGGPATGGGGPGGNSAANGPDGTANTGGGGGGQSAGSGPGSRGGSGIVIIRYKFQN